MSMLKRIRTEDVSLGMFLHKLEGSWLSHPFWKRRFLIEDSETIEQLRNSKVEWIMIDVERGNDVTPAAAIQATDQPPPAFSATPSPLPARGRSAQILGRARRSEDAAPPAQRDVALTNVPRGLAAEMKTATDIAHRSRQVMRGVFTQARLGRTVEISAVEPLVDDIMRSIQRHPHAFTGVMRLMKTSDYLYTHALSVSSLMISLALELGLRPVQVREAGLAGLLMDVGMGHVPSEIYDKEGELTAAEEEIVQSHTRLAHEFVAVGGDVQQGVLDVCLHHHERMDGSGYPDRLSGDAIPLFARMAAICDVYDAMTSRRPHRESIDPAAALATMRDSFHLIDADIFQAFVRAVGIYPIGALVRLASDRLALVLDQNPKNPTLPRVRAFYAISEAQFVEPEDIDLVYRVGKDSIIGPERPTDWPLGDWGRASITMARDASLI